MNYPEISRLYKYHSFNENSLSLLVNRSIWASKPKSLNDPFEMNRSFDLSKPPTDSTLLALHDLYLREFTDRRAEDIEAEILAFEKAIEIGAEEVETYRQEYVESINDRLKIMNDSCGIYSLSACYGKDEDILMWSHYGDSHRGFVIGFDRGDERDIYLQQVWKMMYANQALVDVNSVPATS